MVRPRGGEAPIAAVDDASARRPLHRLVAALSIAASACHSPAPVHPALVAPDVLGALRAHGQAHVVVALATSAQPRDAAGGASARAAIARVQAELLSQLGPEDYRSTQLYAAVPAMAGTVLSERGLRRILAHPHVRGVDLDPGGGGAPSPPR